VGDGGVFLGIVFLHRGVTFVGSHSSHLSTLPSVPSTMAVVLLVVLSTVGLCEREVDPYSLSPSPSALLGELASRSPCCGMWLGIVGNTSGTCGSFVFA
jgi:hypothetical protein